MSPILENVLDKLKGLLNNDIADQLAVDTGFIRRASSKITPLSFLIVMVVEMTRSGVHSLPAMCDLLSAYGSIRMTAQALSLRLNNAATVRFLKRAYSHVIKLKLHQSSAPMGIGGFLSYFTNVYLEDSTCCRLHERVGVGRYKASGGRGSVAGYKVHTIWNATKQCIENLLVTAGCVTDQSQAFSILRFLRKGDLILRDLGYFSAPCFREIDRLGAYFLSRMKAGVNVYTPEGVKIEDFAAYIDRALGDQIQAQVHVLIGSRAQLPVRLLAYRVPKEVSASRIRKLRRAMGKSGQTPRKENIKLQQFTLLITNIPENILPLQLGPTLYKLRWQIELLFKSFKGNFNIELIKGKSSNRAECFIIAKMIAVLVTSAIFSWVSLEYRVCHERELSFAKFSEWILRQKYLMILFEPEKMSYDLLKMIDVDILSLCKQRRSRKTTWEHQEAGTNYEDLYPFFEVLEDALMLA